MPAEKRRFGKNNLCLLVLCVFFSITAAAFFYSLLYGRSVKDIGRIRTIYSERTENYINSIFHKTDILAAVIKLENGKVSDSTFENIARTEYEKNAGIRGIQLMPGAVVTASYPLEGNEAVMGKNFLEIPDRKADVLLAINSKSIALSGPYYLIQGGLGLVARNPVFLNDENGNEYFWGFSTIVLDLPDALASVGLDTLPESGYDFQLYCINENNERIVIEGNPNLDTNHAVCGIVQVPNHEWTFAVKKRNPWSDLLSAALVLLSGLTLSLVFWHQSNLIFNEKQALAAKESFFSNISHDMRTPLNAIIGFSELAENPENTVKQKDEYLHKIRSSGNLLLELVNDTLTVSKASNGKLVLRPEPVSTAELWNAVTEPIREAAAQKGIVFLMDDTAFRQRIIFADRLNLEKIFLNLMNNAVKYTPVNGHIRVIVRDEPADSRDPDLVFTVKDDGIGIRAEFLPHIFEPFAQEGRKGYENNGTGLGLAIVKRLVDLMGGTISVESEADCGTAFTVRLHPGELPFGRLKGPDSEAENADFSLLAGKKILLCEDNELNTELAVLLLTGKGMAVETASNGEAGVKKFKESAEGEYCAVLMDLRMPVMDGYQAAKAIRALERDDAVSVPIIAMTADAFSEDIGKCYGAGMNAHLAKPIRPEKLYQELCTLLLRRPSKKA